jgi:hypothetical protein
VHDLEEELSRVSSLKQKEKIVIKVEKVEVIPHDYEDL